MREEPSIPNWNSCGIVISNAMPMFLEDTGYPVQRWKRGWQYRKKRKYLI